LKRTGLQAAHKSCDGKFSVKLPNGITLVSLMNTPSLLTASDGPAPERFQGTQRLAWVADFVPIDASDPGLQAALRQLQWALETEKQD
jgi:hypothetical protein